MRVTRPPEMPFRRRTGTGQKPQDLARNYHSPGYNRSSPGNLRLTQTPRERPRKHRHGQGHPTAQPTAQGPHRERWGRPPPPGSSAQRGEAGGDPHRPASESDHGSHCARQQRGPQPAESALSSARLSHLVQTVRRVRAPLLTWAQPCWKRWHYISHEPAGDAGRSHNPLRLPRAPDRSFSAKRLWPVNLPPLQ